jgi:MinD superfamily P-loop ATPase
MKVPLSSFADASFYKKESLLKIAIASGKGGTGKTTIAVNLALAVAHKQPVTLLDCDVEEPNCHLFLKPEITGTFLVTIPQPLILEEKCNGCRICADVCEYHALTVLKKQVLVFHELCHGCGACFLLCPQEAIREEKRSIGVVEEGSFRGIRFVQGRLNVGEVMSPAVIRQVRDRNASHGVNIIDSPPGTSCPVVESVRGADFVLLVTEPTPFGLNDLMLAIDMVRALERPFAVALNRCDVGDEGVRSHCEREGIEILLSIPDDRRIAESYSRGEIIIERLPEYRSLFERCYGRIAALVNQKRGGNDQGKGRCAR